MSLKQRIQNLSLHALNLQDVTEGDEPIPQLCDVCRIEPACYGLDGRWYCATCWLTRFAPWARDDE
jgi:hypothetical protein